ncbi:Membrane protein containing HD superfamily hydrolase domain [Mucinivorans hirudinis]|uniref:Membrane protein containing HD superfamily hydrolase domain n=1 Tax=Mucinivorans hirudinis TaxID=1433126 RepID=A0A060RCC7_9BACT|nr:Membrane protein containing HD superfamily hydrolase domain [Mucinivorans hirudinis]
MKKILLLIITALVITLITPQRALVDVPMHAGEVWTEQTLVAPFDVPMVKIKSQIEQEREDVQRNFSPIFRKEVANLKSIQCKEEDVAFVREAYSVGVMPDGEWSKYRDRIIRICDKFNNITSLPTEEIYTPHQIAERLDIASQTLPTNLIYDDKLNKELIDSELKAISTTRNMVRSGEVIVSTGQIIDELTLQKLRSFSLEFESQVGNGDDFYIVLLGRFLIVIILLIINYIFFTKFANLYFGDSSRPLFFILFLYLLMSVLTALVVMLDGVSPYVVPTAIVAIYMMTYFNMRVAIMGNLSVAIIGALFVRIPFDFFFVSFTAGMVAIFMMRHHYHRLNLFKSLGVIILAQIIAFFGVQLIRTASFININYFTISWFVFGALLVLALYQAVYLIERTFGFVSDVTLLELCDTNQKLLLELAEKAPGTFQHSVQVANLAEAAAKEIGANPLLARTGAMYHDIGKIGNPFHFTENQTGEFNPHKDLTPRESAGFIRRHVTDGQDYARKNRLPRQVVDFITGHHGDSRMYYFYAAELGSQGVVEDEEDFRYPGPKPMAKEVGICMMADAVEAASRSLPSYDKEPLEALVDKIINIQISEGQLADSDLTFAEVEKIKALFKAKLNTIYHVRISYPERK